MNIQITPPAQITLVISPHVSTTNKLLTLDNVSLASSATLHTFSSAKRVTGFRIYNYSGSGTATIKFTNCTGNVPLIGLTSSNEYQIPVSGICDSITALQLQSIVAAAATCSIDVLGY